MVFVNSIAGILRVLELHKAVTALKINLADRSAIFEQIFKISFSSVASETSNVNSGHFSKKWTKKMEIDLLLFVLNPDSATLRASINLQCQSGVEPVAILYEEPRRV